MSIKLEKDFTNELIIDEEVPLENLIHSEVVHKKLLIKILKKLEELLDKVTGTVQSQLVDI